MYQIIAYTIHITTCLLMAFMLFANREDDAEVPYSYYKSLKLFACALLVLVPIDVLYLYMQKEGMTGGVSYTLCSLFTGTLFCGILLRTIFTLVCAPHYRTKWQDILMWVYVLVGAIHPVLFVQHCRYARSDSPQMSCDSYQIFLETDTHHIYLYFFYAAMAAYVIVCLCNVVIFLRGYRLWLKASGPKKSTSAVIKLFTFLFVPVCLYYVVMVACSHLGLEYSLDLPLWAVAITVITVFFLRSKKLLTSIARDSLSLQMSYAAGQSSRGQAVVIQTLRNWEDRDDKPFISEELTLATLSKETGIPPTVIIRHLNYAYGLNFNEYIEYLRKSVKSA